MIWESFYIIYGQTKKCPICGTKIKKYIERSTGVGGFYRYGRDIVFSTKSTTLKINYCCGECKKIRPLYETYNNEKKIEIL